MLLTNVLASSKLSLVSLISNNHSEIHYLTILLCYLNQIPTLISTSIVLIILTAAFSFTYLLRVFFLSEFGLSYCQGTHLLPYLYTLFRLPAGYRILHLFYQMLYKSFFVLLYFYLWYIYNSSFVNSFCNDC